MRGSFVSEPVFIGAGWTNTPQDTEIDCHEQPVSDRAKLDAYERLGDILRDVELMTLEISRTAPGTVAHGMAHDFSLVEALTLLNALATWAGAVKRTDDETPAALLVFDGVKSSTVNSASTAGQCVPVAADGEPEDTAEKASVQQEPTPDWYGLPVPVPGYPPNLILDFRQAGCELETESPGTSILVGERPIRFSTSDRQIKALVVFQPNNPRGFAFTYNRSEKTVKAWRVTDFVVTTRMGIYEVGPEITSVQSMAATAQRHVMSGVDEAQAFRQHETVWEQAVRDYDASKPTFRK